jgi:hypothetical protein
MSPELLPYQHVLVESICKDISIKEREISERAANVSKKDAADLRFYLNI